MDCAFGGGDVMKIFCRRQSWSNGVELAVFDYPGKKTLIGELKWREVDEGAEIVEPTARISQEVAQTLMDELWSCGLRPTEGSGSAGSLAATERHLKDMQSITKGLLQKFGVPTA